MHLLKKCDPTLPPLAYFVGVSGRDVVLTHGRMVATGETFFHDGAWAGDFGAGDFESVHRCGTGGRIVDGSLRLVVPNTPIEGLYLTSDGKRTYASNSIAFLLAVLGDSLDPRNIGYRDAMIAAEWGIRISNVTLRTEQGRRIRVLLGQTAEVTAGGDIRITRQPVAVPFTDWSDYRSRLSSTTTAMIQNAADPRRPHPFEPLVPMSSGYDATATAVLAAEAGATSAITMLRFDDKTKVLIDHPGDMPGRLGMDLIEVDRNTWWTREDMPDAHIAAGIHTMGGIALLDLDPHVHGRLVVTGTTGDTVWNVSGHRFANDVFYAYGTLVSRSLMEYRLHAGYVWFSPPSIDHSALPSIHAISNSEEMRPWRLGSGYDRPIPRRIAEDAGIPREQFGVKKYAASARVGNSRTYYPAGPKSVMRSDLESILTEVSIESFLDFLDSIAFSDQTSRLRIHRAWHFFYNKLNALDHHLVEATHSFGVRGVVPRRLMQSIARLGATDGDYTRWLPHWGVNVTMGRYESAVENVNID